MKILVVDDEQIMLDSICLILSREPDLQIEVAHTGREAIEKAEISRPELVMMDLKMPGINGLDALAEIRRLDPQAILVILTAYENFTYAQEAIRLNVYDYLLKPINKARLLELIAKAKQELAKIRELRQKELALREKYQKLLPLIEIEFMYELINGIDEITLGEYRELLGLNFNTGFFLTVSYLDKNNAEVDNIIELGYAIRQKMTELAETIRSFIPCLVGPLKTNPIPVFIPLGLDWEPNPEPGAIARKILYRLQNEKKSADIRIGIGRTYTAAFDLKRSYQESITAVHYCGQNSIIHYDELPQQQEEDWEIGFNQDAQEILEAVKFGNVSKVENLTAQLFAKYARFQGEKDRLFFCLLKFLLAAYQTSKDLNTNLLLSGFEQTIAIFEKIDLSEVLTEIANRIIVLTSIVKESRINQVKAIIRQAKAIIDRQYTEALNLEDISHTIGISPFYFSRLFREELGITFSEYVTKLRLEKALSLLAQGLSVKECCFSVGYNDPNYFSRIFRQYYDMTPSEYRDEQMQLKGGQIK
jgi:two-component system response regulator YesN